MSSEKIILKTKKPKKQKASKKKLKEKVSIKVIEPKAPKKKAKKVVKKGVPKQPKPRRTRNWFLNALTNPFGCLAAKVPDEISPRTGTFSVRGLVSIGQFNGVAAFEIWPRLYKTYYTAASVTSGTVTWDAGNNSSSYTSAIGIWSQVRAVSMGVTITNMCSTSQNGGVIAGAWIPKADTPATVGIATYAGVVGTSGACQQAAKLNTMMIWRPQDNDDWLFQKPTTSAYSIPSLIFMATGLDSTITGSVFAIEFVINFEAIPTNSGQDLVDLSPSPVEPGLITETWSIMNELQTLLPYTAGAVLSGATPFIYKYLRGTRSQGRARGSNTYAIDDGPLFPGWNNNDL